MGCTLVRPANSCAPALSGLPCHDNILTAENVCGQAAANRQGDAEPQGDGARARRSGLSRGGARANDVGHTARMAEAIAAAKAAGEAMMAGRAGTVCQRPGPPRLSFVRPRITLANARQTGTTGERLVDHVAGRPACYCLSASSAWSCLAVISRGLCWPLARAPVFAL
jgi:hypothetical protein